MERMVLMAKSSWALVRRTFRPSLVQVVRMGRNVVQQSALTDAAVFFMIYMMCMAIWIGVVTATEGTSVETAFGAVLTCLSNMGPAPFHVGADNFASYSGFSKYFLALAMLLGRLEFFTVLALLVPGFWRR
jgi:trk system potassium uptake protein TrkH